MMSNIAYILNVLLRNDFKSFVIKVFNEVNPGQKFIDGWYIDLLCDRLQDLMDGKERRLIINIPPRYLKSMICSIALPAYILGKNPAARIMCVSYAEELSSKLAYDCRVVMASKWFKKLFPGTVIDKNRSSAIDFDTTKHGGRFATTMGGTITGRGADYIIIDDPLKPGDANSDVMRGKINELYSGTIYSRLNSQKDGSIILIMQRLHENDLTGHLLETDPRYKHIKLPLIAEDYEHWYYKQPTTGKPLVATRYSGDLLHPERDDEDVADYHRRNLGEYAFSAQYQQDPVPSGGGLVKKEWMQFCAPPHLSQMRQVVLSWDTASKVSAACAYSACVVIGVGLDDNYYLLNVFRERLEFPALVRQAMQLAEEYEQKCPGCLLTLVEDASSGMQLIQALREKEVIVKPYHVKGSKIQRFDIVTYLTENGRILYPNIHQSWFKEFEYELLAFPRSRYSDQCDAFSQALQYIREIGQRTNNTAPVGATRRSPSSGQSTGVGTTGRDAMQNYSGGSTGIASRGNSDDDSRRDTWFLSR